MEKSTKLKSSAVLTIGLILCVIVLIFKVHQLTQQVNHLQNNYNIAFSNLENDIALIYDNVDQKLRAEASLITDIKYEYGELDTHSHRLPLALTITPKALTKDMVVSVQVGSESTVLTRQGQQFHGTIPVELFVGYDSYPLLSITSMGTTQTQQLTQVDITYLCHSYLPTLYARYSGHASFTQENGLTLKGEIAIDYHHQGKGSAVTFGDLVLTAERNEKELSRNLLGSPLTETEGHFTQPLEMVYPVVQGDLLTLYIWAEDSLGYYHKIPAYQWQASSNGLSVPVMDTCVADEQIYDRNGVLLNAK